jgi:ABC-type glycerol-3-phosphate transport system substrate-binding protein
VVTAVPPTPGPVKISAQSAWCADPATTDVWGPSIKLFKEKNPKIDVEFINVATAPEDVMTSMAGGTAADVVHFYSAGWNELLTKPVILPLDDMIKGADKAIFDESIFLKTQWDYCRYNGKIYAIPALEGGANPAFSWHKKLVADAGGDPEKGPKDWADVQAWAKKINKLDASGNLELVGYDPLDAWGVTILNWDMAFDAPMASDDGKKMLLDQPNWIQGLEILASFWWDAGPEKMASFNQQWGYWTGGANSGFGNAKRAMITNGTWQPGELMHNHKDHLDLTQVGYGFHPCITGKKYVNFGQEHTLFAPKLTKQPDAAFRFMAHMASLDVNKIEFELRGACMWSTQTATGIDTSGIPGLQWFFDAPNQADKLWGPDTYPPIMTQVEKYWTQAIQETIYKTKTAKQALTDANGVLQKALDEYWQTQAS